MPVAVKQKPNDKAPPPHANGSLLSRGVPVKKLAEVKRVCLLIYGGNRTGKTTLACQFDKPLALVSFEPNLFTGGSASVTGDEYDGVKNFLIIPSTAEERYNELRKLRPELQEAFVGTGAAEQLARELMFDKHFRTVVVDGGTSMQDVFLTEIMNLPELPQQMAFPKSKGDTSWGVATEDQYRDRSSKTKELLRKFINLPQDVVICCKEKDHNPPKDERTGQTARNKLTRGLTLESFVASDLGQATTNWLHDCCEIVRLYHAKETNKTVIKVPGAEDFVQETETGRIVRRLLTQYHPNFAAGLRSPRPQNIPEYIEDATPQGMYRKLRAVLRGEKIA